MLTRAACFADIAHPKRYVSLPLRTSIADRPHEVLPIGMRTNDRPRACL